MRLHLASALLVFTTAASAADLKIDVKRNGFSGPIDVAIAPRVEGRLPEWSKHQTIAAGRSSATFRGIANGLYIVLTSGPEPLQRLSAKANVGSGESLVHLDLPRTRASFHVTLAEEPFGHAEIKLTQDELRWSMELETDDAGHYTGALWEPGLYTASVTHGNTAPHVVDVMVTPQPVKIDVPDRDVMGRVLDQDGKPIASALVMLKTQSEESTLTVRTLSAPDGGFVFLGVREGVQTLSARARTYLNSDDASFDLRGASAHHVADLTMPTGTHHVVRVIDERGKGIADASLFTSCDGHIKSTTVSGADGRAEVAVPANGSCAIFALPKEGSLAMGYVQRNAPLVLRVPDGSSSLKLEIASDKGDVFSELWLLMRIDGTVVPPAIARQLATRGLSLMTNAQGTVALAHIPPGTYEFWPYRNDAEGQRLYEIAGDFAAPISVNVLSGENNAKVKFAARR
jgi:hypothetical protein